MPKATVSGEIKLPKPLLGFLSNFEMDSKTLTAEVKNGPITSVEAGNAKQIKLLNIKTFFDISSNRDTQPRTRETSQASRSLESEPTRTPYSS